jgi:very-short-patch-repair endonuclease
MPFDFGLEEHRILIELDGIQHFEQVSNWEDPENVQFKDVEKIHYSITNGYSVIHIFQVEVWNDRYDWKTVLKEQIQRLIEKKEACCVFISQKPMYDRHISQLSIHIPYEVVNVSVE